MGGFYYWNSIKYFLYEYEFQLAKKNNIDKVSWEMFTKTEKDKVSIEHILPQAPTKYYWKNQFRQFDDEEIELLSCALGNLLPLSQSINSDLQNDSFEDKKTSKTTGRRGYQNGSHSEIEVAIASDAEDSRNLLMQSQNANLTFIKNQPESFLGKFISGAAPEKVNSRMNEIRESLCAVNMVSLSEAIAYQEMGETEAARLSLQYYAR